MFDDPSIVLLVFAERSAIFVLGSSIVGSTAGEYVPSVPDLWYGICKEPLTFVMSRSRGREQPTWTFQLAGSALSGR